MSNNDTEFIKLLLQNMSLEGSTSDSDDVFLYYLTVAAKICKGLVYTLKFTHKLHEFG